MLLTLKPMHRFQSCNSTNRFDSKFWKPALLFCNIQIFDSAPAAQTRMSKAAKGTES